MSTNAVQPQSIRTAGDSDAVTQYDVQFARQPILDRDAMLCGFELKSRAVDLRNSAFVREEERGDPREVVARAVVEAALEPAVRAALVGHRAYLDVTRELLFDEAVWRLPPERFAFELPLSIGADAGLIARLIELHAKRYRFVLDDVVQANDTFAKLLPYAEAVKIDIRRIAPALLPKFASVLKAAGKLLIATGVHTHDDFQKAIDLGFDRVQGYFFALPGSSRRASAPRQALLNLLQLLANEPTVAQLEAELKLNPVLVMHLMRLANSGSFSIGRKVTTLREAINATGTNRIARWTQLLLYADGRKVSLEDDPLLQLAATRARFMELAVGQLPDAGRDVADAAFLAGVFSFVDAVFGGTLESTLDMLTLSRPIRAAIIERVGALGQLLDAAEALEAADWERVDTVAAQLAPLTSSDIAALGLAAGEWAGMADRNAEAAGLERIED